MERRGESKRKTNETNISISLNIDGGGECSVDTSVPFLDHMLSQIAKHGFFDMKVAAKGDTNIDFHHTVEDAGIVLGDVFKSALGDKKGIRRYGYASIPLNEALANVTVDLSGRPYFVYNVNLPKEKVGDFDVELIEEFFNAFAVHCGVTLHINVPYGTNLHHIVEAVFKSFAKAMDMATAIDERSNAVPSTKGNL